MEGKKLFVLSAAMYIVLAIHCACTELGSRSLYLYSDRKLIIYWISETLVNILVGSSLFYARLNLNVYFLHISSTLAESNRVPMTMNIKRLLTILKFSTYYFPKEWSRFFYTGFDSISSEYGWLEWHQFVFFSR